MSAPGDAAFCAHAAAGLWGVIGGREQERRERRLALRRLFTAVVLVRGLNIALV